MAQSFFVQRLRVNKLAVKQVLDLILDFVNGTHVFCVDFFDQKSVGGTLLGHLEVVNDLSE
jgi:hypothetical protein